MLCVCCGMQEAFTGDYRERYGTLSKYPVCKECFNLSNGAFFMKMGRTEKRMLNRGKNGYCEFCGRKLRYNKNGEVINNTPCIPEKLKEVSV